MYDSAARSEIASRLAGFTASALSSALRASSCLLASAASPAKKIWASTDDGLTASARVANVAAWGGLSSARARAAPTSAGVHFGSICSTIWYDFSAWALSYFSRNRSPNADSIAASLGAERVASM